MLAHVEAQRLQDSYMKGQDPDAVLRLLVSQRAVPSLALAQQMKLAARRPGWSDRADDFTRSQQIATLGWIGPASRPWPDRRSALRPAGCGGAGRAVQQVAMPSCE